ncbi:DUF167 domain-containing protein [Methanolobus chelungpuianus]|uniref:UPF0235 protein PV02_05475 n=1 Tax=Methanolobus chelungpuianus TaxID=502115 RepID=A0AAE3KX02_9EURY|nr:DUF167 domain-containing protein [Methanolobus chelungpuianus]MCQ6962586.1 hypothetical protein [Methanolobus chelungpuianus]
MSFEDAIKIASGGVIIDIEVTPGSRRTCIPGGYNPWRKRIEVKLSENAQKGKANEQLVEGFSSLFGVREADISIVTGLKNTKKSVLLMGVSREEAVSVMGRGLDKLA